MFYAPKHCNECGEKIDDSTRKSLISRRFCEICESDLKIIGWLPRLFFAFCCLIALIGIGSGLKKTDQSLNVSTTPFVSVTSNKNQASQVSVDSANRTGTQNAVAATDTDLLKKQAPVLESGQIQPQEKSVARKTPQNSASETIYFCGAQTKKGTPCSRRVKGGGRCWQHKGQPAMLPPEKLIASR